MVEYRGFRDENIRTNEINTSDTPDKNMIRKMVAFDLCLFLERKKIIKNIRREIFRTLIVNGVMKNHFIIKNLIDYFFIRFSKKLIIDYVN